jgi:hypothetical protein
MGDKFKYIVALSVVTLLCTRVAAQAPVRMSNDKVCVFGLCDSGAYSFLSSRAIYEERWDDLPQAKFWRKVMRTTPDSGYLSVAGCRTIIGKYATKEWQKMNDETRDCITEDARNLYCLGNDDKLLFTAGKNDFYKIEPVLSTIDRGIKIFEQENTDPFYAQVILLIESPGRMQKSTVGAYGPFQLMRSVAKRMGLKVNNGIDERKNFERSAWAAAKLIRTICVPETKAILDRNGIKYNEKDLWFRLLVLHVYHAGAGNVAPVIDKICPTEGNQELIKQVWQTSYGYFKNSSQNYSQLALASLLELDEHIFSRCVDLASGE